MIDEGRRGELHSIAVTRAAEAIEHARANAAVDDVCKTNEEARYLRDQMSKVAEQVRNLP